MTGATRNDQVADLIAQRRKARRRSLVRDASDEPAPLSSVQLSLWTVAALDASHSAANRPCALRLRGPLDHEALRTALQGLVERHEPLRTIYPLDGQEPVQRVLEPFPVDVEVVDTSALGSAERIEGLNEVLEQARTHSFDLTSEAAFSAMLVVENADSHVLVLALSHIGFDGWSEQVLCADLTELYRAALEGGEPQLPVLDIRYSDYARWQRRDQDSSTADLAYWHGSLAGLGHTPPLPVTIPSAPAEVSTCVGRLDAAELAAVVDRARHDQTTPFVVLLAALELLGRELLDAEDFAVSCPVAGRDRSEVQHLVGCFINPILIRSSVADVQTTGQLLGAVRSRVLAGLAHRLTPASDVVEPWAASRPRPALHRLSLQWRDFPRRSPAGEVPIDVDVVEIADPSSALAWSASPDDDGVSIAVEFKPELFDSATVAGWIERFRHLLALVCDPRDHPLPTPEPSHCAPDPCAPLVAEVIEPVILSVQRQVRMTPDAIAVVCDDREISYAELWRRSGAVAGQLIQQGVEPGDPVVVLSTLNAGHVAAMLGVWRAGAMAVPVDASLPAGQRVAMTEVAGARHAALVDDCADIGSDRVSHVVHVDRLGHSGGHDEAEFGQARVGPLDDRAYLMFTSGTTGAPKAIVGTHQGLSHFLGWQRSRLAVRPGDIVAGITGPSFDVSLREIFLPLSSGAALSIAPDNLRIDQGIDWLRSCGASVLHITPSLAAAWLAEGTGAGGRGDNDDRSSDLRWTVLAGEPLQADVVERWRGRVSNSVRLINLYGPTETCLAKASHEVSDPSPGVQPVGTPLPYSQLLVVAVDEARLCAPAEVGEVVIRTAIGTQGYLNDEGGGFVVNPFAPESGEVVYRTGDVGWYAPDWSVTVHGRLDDQVKIDGVRVEPGEAANRLTEHPNVSQCVVLPVGESGSTRLEAFVVPRGQPPRPRDLRSYLRQHLRTAAIPSAFHTVPRIPLTPNHKADRLALLGDGAHDDVSDEATAVQAAAPVGHDAPMPAGDVVSASWGDVLGQHALDPSADFFGAGGTSLKAQRILAQLEAKTGTSAPIELFFDHPTLGEFVQAFTSLTDADHHAGRPFTEHGEVSGGAAVVPLSFAQQRLWVIEQVTPGLGQYVVPICRHIHGPLDIEALEQAFTQLVARHDVLRSRVVAERGEPRLIIGPPEWVGAEVHDLRSMSDAPREARVEALVTHFAEAPFDLAHDLPVRVRIIRVRTEEWVLVISMHHIVIDGLSYALLFEELGAFYAAALESRPAALEPLEAQYSDFAAWQRDRVADHAYDRQLDYWASALAAPAPRAPSGSPEPGGDPEAPAWARRRLPDEFKEKVAKLAGDLRVSPFMVVLAMVSGVICDETDQDEMATAIVFADRSWPHADDLLGYFINTLPVRVPAPRGASLAETTAAVRTVTLDAYQNGDVPLDIILEHLSLDRGTVDRFINSVDVDLSEEDLVADLAELAGTTSEMYNFETSFLKFDLQIALSSVDGAMTLRVKGRASLYGESDVARIADRFIELADRCLDDPSLPVRCPEPADESSVPPELVPSRLRRLANAEPDRAAIVDGDQVLTRSQLVDHAASIGAFLASRGVRPGDRVVLAASRSATAVAAMYGIWSAGAAYVPIDPAHQSARTHSIIAQCEPSLVLTDDPSLNADVPVALLGAAVVHGADAGQLPGASAESPAYVIYTSGSTGQPKGVVVSHRAVAAFVDGARHGYGLASTDTMLQFHSFAFDASVEELHLPVAVGARVVLRPEDLLGSARRFVAYLEAHSISVVSLPTAFWHELTHQLAGEQLALPECTRMLIIGGEVAQPEVVAAWHGLGSTAVLINSYGPTETTVAVAGGVVSPSADGELASVGRPFASVAVVVVDEHDGAVEPGGWGELLISGPQLADGYFRLPDVTAEVFIQRADGRRWYRTGDRARCRPDGSVEVSGRFDQQLKVDGHRVEPGEIEAALRSLDGVVDGVVVPSVSDGAVFLHAFVTGDPVDARSIRARMAQRVPPQMVPAHIHHVEAFPVGVGGKVDRGALRALLGEPDSKGTPEVVSGGTVDRMVALWGELLGVGGVHAGSDFFELGGRSLTAVRLAYLIESEFGVSLPVAAIFDAPTVGALSAAVDAEFGVGLEVPVSEPGSDQVPASAEPAVTEKVEVVPVTEVAEPTSTPVSTAIASERPWLDVPVRLHLDLAPLALSQQRIWLHQQLRSGSLGYRIPIRYRLRGPLDVDALKLALERLVARHEVLRTRIVIADGRPLQRVTPPGAVAPDLVTFVDLADHDPLERPDRADLSASAWIERPFDLENDHPFDALFLRLTPREHQLVLRFHHIAVDAASVSLLTADLRSLYIAATGHGEPPPEPVVQFADYATWQRARVAGGLHDEAVADMRDIIGDAPRAIDLPGRRPDAKPGGEPTFHAVDLPRATAEALRQLADQKGISSFQLLVALTAATLHRLTGSAQVALGAPISERVPGATDSVIGLLVNTMVVPTEVTSETTFNGLLAQVRTRVGRSLEGGGVPFDLLLDELNAPRDQHRLPLVSTMCTMHEAGSSRPLDLPGIDVDVLARTEGDGAIVADLMVAGVIDAAGELTFDLRHDDAVLEPWVVAEMARSFGTLAMAAASHPDWPIAELPVLEPDEGRWLAEALNQNAGDFPGDARVEESVADIAASQPATAAVVDASGAMTYAELVEEARALAERLQSAGVEPGNTVAIAVDRSASLVVAMLAALQVGAVYVPIDGAAPPQRREDIQRMAGVQALVTTIDGQLVVRACDHEPVPLPQVEGEVPAYVMFTSGSTGIPKGAVISHRAIQRTVQNIDYAPLGTADVVAMASNPAFDALTFEVWGALLNGARLEVFEADTLGDPPEFARQLADRSVTSMFLTTSLVNVINQAAPGAFACLDTLIVGGEAVNVSTMRELVEHGPRRLVNGYGPTECTTFSVWHLVEAVEDDAWTIPIGRPTRNTSVHVLDERGGLVPRGIPGELYIAGPGVALGYLGDEELTNERFVEVIIDGETVRAYRTGDVVRRRLDGTIEYLGRRDHQVKLRGFRIELGGIETALLNDDDVGAAVVRLIGEDARRHLVAYVAPAKGARLDEASLRSRLAAKVPSYMLPSQYVMLDDIPLNKSGKVDRLALPDPAPGAVVTDRSNESLTELEATVVEIWSQVLDGEAIGADDDFFDHGGNSLLGVEALAAAENHFGLHFRLSNLFEARTPRAFAAMIAAQQLSLSDKGVVHFVTLQGGDPSQTPLWLIHPAGGSLVLYEPLARHLPSNRRILGVEASGLDGESEPLDSVEALADHQFETIMHVQPHGPYRLLGYSIGGIVGVELARRLQARGESVEFLGAIESGVPSGPTELLSRRDKYSALLRRRDIKGVAASLRTSFRNRRDEREARVAAGRSDLDRAHKRVLDSMVHAFHQFVPSELDVSMTLFFGDASSEASVGRLQERWGELATRGVTVRRVSGSHADDVVLREPHAMVLAAAVEEALVGCDQDPHGDR